VSDVVLFSWCHHHKYDIPRARMQDKKCSRAHKESDPKVDTGTSGRRVVEIRELLDLIVHTLDTKQQCKLMGVSKYFFCSAGPVVWRRVPRLDIIMSLVKNVEVKGEKSCADDKWQFVSHSFAYETVH
jgi:hypothetical protein